MRLEALGGQRFVRGRLSSLVKHIAFTDERERKMCKRSQVAAGADRSVARHHRRDVALDQIENETDQLGRRAGKTGQQRVGAQHHHQSNRVAVERLTRGRRVTAQEIVLQLGRVFRVDMDAREFAEAGVDSVMWSLVRGHARAEIGARAHARQGVRGWRHTNAAGQKFRKVVETERVSVDGERAHAVILALQCAPCYQKFCSRSTCTLVWRSDNPSLTAKLKSSLPTRDRLRTPKP